MEQTNVLTKSIVFCDEDFCEYGILPSSLLREFQAVATTHADLLGVGYADMLKKNLLWVTMRIKFEIVEQPQKNVTFKLTTYPSSKNMFEYDRDFLIVDESGKELVKATSKWCLIDREKRRVVMVKDEFAPLIPNQAPLFEGRFLKTDLFEPKFLPDYSYIISFDDIDNNHHTNNISYAKMVQELLNCEKRNIKFFQINFLKETKESQRIDLYRQDDQNKLDILGKICESENSFSAHIEFD